MATMLILQHHAKYDASIHLQLIEMKMKKRIKKMKWQNKEYYRFQTDTRYSKLSHKPRFKCNTGH